MDSTDPTNLTDSTDSTDSGQRIYEVPEYQGPLTRLGLITNKRLSPGYKPMPGPHRCYSHYKDIGNGLLSDPLEFIKPFSIFWRCIKSEKGNEPPRWRPVKEELLNENN
ncbi:hypothetical protein Glove_415g10 [Diversispora epigaea]|uniref:Uncharacterized protein n=1 Tax=Diversispora epigaea TaxID=1348612 RepID=A0A397H4U6_9GLOM|nr:hypothetical protein Glove_415g10 [Diversispora epigaea]